MSIQSTFHERRKLQPSNPRAAFGIGLHLQPWFSMLAGLLRDMSSRLIAQSALNTASLRRHVRSGPVGGRAKRILDIVVASTALVLLMPMMLFVAALIRLQMGGPVIFRHPRVGYRGKLFPCMKFRTMLPNGDEILQNHLANNPAAQEEWAKFRKLQDDPRVTRLGRFLRKSSIDELPQLFNVLRGEMSCVGPRPIVADELKKYGPHARHYLRAVPGLTGIWQISGRSSTTYRRRVVMDVLYVRSPWSVWRELRILLMTVPAVLWKTEDAA